MTFKPEKEKKIIIFVNYVTIYLITHMGLLISFNVWQYQIQSRGVTREENRAADCQRSLIKYQRIGAGPASAAGRLSSGRVDSY